MSTNPRSAPMLLLVSLIGTLCANVCFAESNEDFDPYAFATDAHQLRAAKALVEFFEIQTQPPEFEIRTGDAFVARRAAIRRQILDSIGLSPFPQRVPLDIHQSESLEHPWASVRKVHYQIWPGVYSEAFLYLPKVSSNKPCAVILSLTGHWPNGKAYADEQKRCLNFARLGYVVVAPDQNHYEDLPLGISHQTHMVWSNIRALDLIQTLDGVDANRVGACGGSGGGYQVQMLLAIDDRIKAATIMGFTCDYRETVFPHVASCTCLHFPNALAIANMPEVSAQGMPVPVQYLTMNDYTRNFAENAFPKIKELYSKNGYADHVECLHWPTEHIYDKPKREATYRWMGKWLDNGSGDVEEIETKTFPIPRLLGLNTQLPTSAKRIEDLSAIYLREHHYTTTDFPSKALWVKYRDEKSKALKHILGVDRTISPASTPEIASEEVSDQSGIRRQSFDLLVEANLRIPVTILRPDEGGPFKPLVLCSGQGRKNLLAATGPDSPTELAQSGYLVVVPDLRFFGEIDLDNLIGAKATSLLKFVPSYSQDDWLCNQDYSFHYHIDRAWQRNSILWGRPLTGMIVTDLQKILDHLQKRSDVDMGALQMIAASSKEDPEYSVPLALLFAAVLDQRVKQVDVDLGGKRFGERTLPAIPFILWHGDVLQWAACVADRKLILRNVSSRAGDSASLRQAFDVAGSSENLKLISSTEGMQK